MEQELDDCWADGVHPDDVKGCLETYLSSFDARRDFQREYRLQRFDGEYRWVLDTAVPRFAPGNVFAGYIGSCMDVTEFKRNQEQLVAMQKLESLGVLAAGIAHDFNNMLGSIFAEADLALSHLPMESPVRESLDRIGAVATRGSEVLNLMMDYAGGKHDNSKLEADDVSASVVEMREFLKVSISKKAVFETQLADDLLPVRANPTQIRRLLMNLLTNASEALEEREGLIRISTSTLEIHRASRMGAEANLRPGTYAVIEVTDTGRGMTEQEQRKIFDPFFTTKSAGRGLGLSAVQGMLRSHGGTIEVFSEPGRGSTFKVFLPCEPKQAAKPDTLPVRAVQPAASGGETVLLVEDEETLRLAVSMSLQKNGFKVVAAADGYTALDLFRARAADIDIVLLDVTLPGLSGPEVFREVRQIKPEAKIVVTSAYNRDRISADFASADEDEEPSFHFIRKPYRISDLVRNLRESIPRSDGAPNLLVSSKQK
jgi:two-component system, cell cycle sensor histidine kinase and response regulator CckA